MIADSPINSAASIKITLHHPLGRSVAFLLPRSGKHRWRPLVVHGLVVKFKTVEKPLETRRPEELPPLSRHKPDLAEPASVAIDDEAVAAAIRCNRKGRGATRFQ